MANHLGGGATTRNPLLRRARIIAQGRSAATATVVVDLLSILPLPSLIATGYGFCYNTVTWNIVGPWIEDLREPGYVERLDLCLLRADLIHHACEIVATRNP